MPCSSVQGMGRINCLNPSCSPLFACSNLVLYCWPHADKHPCQAPFNYIPGGESQPAGEKAGKQTDEACPGPGRRVLTQTRRVRDSVTPIGFLAYFYERRDFLLSDSGARVHGLLPVCLCSLDRACSVVLTEGG